MTTTTAKLNHDWRQHLGLALLYFAFIPGFERVQGAIDLTFHILMVLGGIAVIGAWHATVAGRPRVRRAAWVSAESAATFGLVAGFTQGRDVPNLTPGILVVCAGILLVCAGLRGRDEHSSP